MISFVIKYKNVRWTIKVILLAALIVTTSGYALSSVPGNIYYFLLVLPIVLFLLKKKESLLETPLNIYISSYLIFCILTIISFAIYRDISSIPKNIKFLITITFAFYFTYHISFQTFLKYFVLSMKVIVIVSLIGYLLINVINIPINLPKVVNVNGVEYYNAIIYFAPSKGFAIDRNIGCFWEPGVFSTFIIIALIFEIALKKRTSVRNVIIFIVGLLSTQSTSGYLMILFLFILKLSLKHKGFKGLINYTVLILLGALAYLNFNSFATFLYSINPKVFSKLFSESSNFTSRIESSLTNLEIFFKHPVLGAGIGNADTLFQSASGAAQTSTSTYFLAIFGIFGILYTLFFVYGILSFKSLNIFSRITILIVILFQINKEPHFFFTSTYIIMFYFLKISSNKSLRAPLRIDF